MSVAELITRRAPITAGSFDPETRTFETVLSTGAAVQRRDARGDFDEVLDLTGVDPAALVGLPYLDGHRQSGSADVIGKIVAAWKEGAKLIGRVQLSAAEGVRDIATKIGEGILRDTSIGYGAASRTESVDPKTGRRTVTIEPQIREASIVPIGADPAARIRSDMMPNEPTTPEDQPGDRTEIRAAVLDAARIYGMTAEWAEDQITNAADVGAVRAAAFATAMGQSAPVIRTQHANQNDNDNPAVILERRANALFARVSGTAPDDAARQYMTDSIADHARGILTLRGVSATGMDREQILLRAAQLTTSDFTNLLTGVGNRALMPSYQAAQSPLKALARQALLPDFRATTKLKLSGIGQLEKVSESGEIKATSRSEATESYALDTYGSIFALSRKAIINDDLGAFRDWANAAGQAAASTENQLMFSMLTVSSGAGPVMAEDNKRLFHADHGNLAGSGTALGQDAMSDARKALRGMTATDGETLINVVPKFLLVGPEMETQAEMFLTETSPMTYTDVNPFASKLTLLVEPRITDYSWYVFADPAAVPVFEYAYLSSAQGPQMASREGWDVLGMEFRVTLDFSSGAIDWRGAYRNPGSAS